MSSTGRTSRRPLRRDPRPVAVGFGGHRRWWRALRPWRDARSALRRPRAKKSEPSRSHSILCNRSVAAVRARSAAPDRASANAATKRASRSSGSASRGRHRFVVRDQHVAARQRSPGPCDGTIQHSRTVARLGARSRQCASRSCVLSVRSTCRRRDARNPIIARTASSGPCRSARQLCVGRHRPDRPIGQDSTPLAEVVMEPPKWSRFDRQPPACMESLSRFSRAGAGTPWPLTCSCRLQMPPIGSSRALLPQAMRRLARRVIGRGRCRYSVTSRRCRPSRELANAANLEWNASPPFCGYAMR